MSFDPYQILGVQRHASTDEIRRVYRALARRYHPDVNGGAQAAERFKLLAQAYSVLSDGKRRALFDRFGEASLALGFDPARAAAGLDRGGHQTGAEPQPSEGRAPRHARRGPDPRAGQEQPPGLDLHRPLQIELLTALRGGQVKVASPSGALVNVEIPAGVETGQRIRLKGRGRPGQGGRLAGDLYFEVEVLPHPFFRRDGRHLVLELPLTIEEAWRGADIEIPSLEGWLRLRVPAGSRGGERLRLRGKGPRAADGNRGDLYVHLCIRLPDRLDLAARSLERLGALYSTDVRAGLRL